ncbi:hypothetical protein D3C72_2588480 [compost metagenome]
MQRAIGQTLFDAKAAVLAPEARIAPAAKRRGQILGRTIDNDLPSYHLSGKGRSLFRVL